MNVLRVCKLFHEEGTKIFWSPKRFLDYRPIRIVADSPGLYRYTRRSSIQRRVEHWRSGLSVGMKSPPRGIFSGLRGLLRVL
ncbi:hypothetical protein BDV12DRAFT_163274 [Aspergillus spectabilis]